MKQQDKDAALAGIAAARPIIKGVIALILQMRYPAFTVEQCFGRAEQFVRITEEEVKYK